MLDISYVITVYNKSKYMDPMLNALERQTGDFSCEYIFVDDGSSDHSVEMIRARTEAWQNVRIIEQENTGPSGATNTGGFIATGEFIKIVDADDVLTNYATIRMLEIMREHKLDHLSTSWVLSDDVEADALKATDDSAKVTILENPFWRFIKYGMGGSTSTMIRTQAFKDIQGCDPSVFVQDFSLPLRLSRFHKMGTSDLLSVIGPRAVEGRILDAQATVIHDLSATMYHFLRDNVDVEADLQRLAFKRCAGRAWKWAKREQKKTILCKAFYLYVLAQLPFWSKTASWIKQTMYVWDNEDVRHPPKR